VKTVFFGIGFWSGCCPFLLTREVMVSLGCSNQVRGMFSSWNLCDEVLVWRKLSLLCVGVVKVHPVRDTSCAINCHYLSKEGRDSGIPDWPLSKRTSTMAVIRCVMYNMIGTCDTISQNSLNRVVRIEYVSFFKCWTAYSLSIWRTLLSGTELQGLGFRSGEDVECFCWRGGCGTQVWSQGWYSTVINSLCGCVEQVVSPPNDGISSLSFSPKANYLVATSWDNQVVFYSFSTFPIRAAVLECCCNVSLSVSCPYYLSPLSAQWAGISVLILILFGLSLAFWRAKSRVNIEGGWVSPAISPCFMVLLQKVVNWCPCLGAL